MIKKGDLVKIISGKDRGKQGKVLEILPKLNMAQVEAANILVKHIKSGKKGTPGQKVEFPSPLHISNLQLICPKCGKAARTGYSLKENKKIRICRRCKEEI